MADISTFRTKLDQLIKDIPSQFTNTEKDAFITEAVRQYSRDKPRERVANLTGDGSKQTFSTPADWVDDFSVLESIEFPVDEVPRQFLDLQDDSETFKNASGVEVVSLTTVVLANSELARIRYRTTHVVDGSSSSIPDNDFDAVVNLAGHHFATAIALFLAEAKDSSLGADVVDHASRAAVFQSLADALLTKYETHIETGEVQTAELQHHDNDIRYSFGQDMIWHKKRFR